MLARIRVAAALVAAFPLAGWSDSAADSEPRAAPAALKNDDARIIEEVVVTAHPLSSKGLAQATAVLEGEQLKRMLAPSLGATLEREPGIHNARFGNTAGRPVIHGVGGPRVRIMEDRIDTLDLSVTSPDHATMVEPFIAERIEVLKGSAALLYGTGAIGGIVDVHTDRIPHDVPLERVTGGVETRYDTNTNGNATAAKLNGGGGRFAWHVDGVARDGDDYQIPGFAESAALHALEEEDASGEEAEHEAARGELPGSAFDFESGAVGASFIGERAFVGAAISFIDANYGLPGGHAHAHQDDAGEAEEHGDGVPTLELEQTRTDFELGIDDPFAGVKSANVRLGINDYEHSEVEPDGAAATRFDNDAWELRAELDYERALWSGTAGIQHTDRRYAAIGEEAFVQPVDSTDSGLFLAATRPFDGYDLEAGARIGRARHDSARGPDTDFGIGAASAGLVIPITRDLRAGVIADWSRRAPVAEELYSAGPHLTTGTFELGDPDLEAETAINLSATFEWGTDIWDATITVYHTEFADFIYQQPTGAVEDELPVVQYRQDDASFTGIDVEIGSRLVAWSSGETRWHAIFDVVDARLDVAGNDNVPRLSPLRWGVGLHTIWGPVTATVDWLRVAEQDDVAPLELPTDAYEDLSAWLGVDLPVVDTTLTLFMRAANLTDDEQRQHTSFIKDFAPAPGRTIEAGARLEF
jgi:iron complex outermembrane receptor protein